MSIKSATVLPLRDYRAGRRPQFFTRSELNQLLGLYSRNVARGVWRDYAIDHRDGRALFSVFRHTHESALYTIVKSASSAAAPAEFVVMSGRPGRIVDTGSSQHRGRHVRRSTIDRGDCRHVSRLW